MTYKPKTPPMRKGAMDAFTKPSLINGKPTERKPPTIGCVGVLKDQRPHHNHT